MIKPCQYRVILSNVKGIDEFVLIVLQRRIITVNLTRIFSKCTFCLCKQAFILYDQYSVN